MWMAFIPLRSSACAERKESFLAIVRHCRDYEHVQTLPATHTEIIMQELACRNYQEHNVREVKCPSYLQSQSLEVLVHPIPLKRKVLALYVLLSRGQCESCMPLLPYLLQDWCSQPKVHECCNSLLQMKWNWILIHIEIPFIWATCAILPRWACTEQVVRSVHVSNSCITHC